MADEKKTQAATDDRQPMSVRAKRSKGAQDPMGTLKRIIGMVFKFYPVLLPLFILCVITPAILQSLPSIFLQEALAVVGDYWKEGDWAAAAPLITGIAGRLIFIYAISIALVAVREQLGAIITQGTLMHLRNTMFEHMEDLPISYFDRNKHGDVMSYYTNDVDTIRQLISQALPNVLTMALAMASVLAIMLWYSVWMALVVLVMVGFMAWLDTFSPLAASTILSTRLSPYTVPYSMLNLIFMISSKF
jgi:ATP-binding cassette subfamily B protein